MIPAEDPLSDIPSYVEPTDDEGEGVGDPEPLPGGFDGDMEIGWLTDHLMAKLMSGPDCSAASQEASSRFELAFGGKRITCRVPRDAVSETSGEKLDPALLYASMKLELEELESFKVGEVVSEREARRLAKESGRRVLSSRWVNTVKKPGLCRSTSPPWAERRLPKESIPLLRAWKD